MLRKTRGGRCTKLARKPTRNTHPLPINFGTGGTPTVQRLGVINEIHADLGQNLFGIGLNHIQRVFCQHLVIGHIALNELRRLNAHGCAFRTVHIYCEIHPYQKVTDAFLAELAPKAVILSGGPDSVTREGSPRAPDSLWALGVPVLGICYGQQTMMVQLGGEVHGGKISGGGGTAEFGRAYVTPTDDRIDLLTGWFAEDKEQVQRSTKTSSSWPVSRVTGRWARTANRRLPRSARRLATKR